VTTALYLLTAIAWFLATTLLIEPMLDTVSSSKSRGYLPAFSTRTCDSSLIVTPSASPSASPELLRKVRLANDALAPASMESIGLPPNSTIACSKRESFEAESDMDSDAQSPAAGELLLEVKVTALPGVPRARKDPPAVTSR
jgi:hypothetical protein